MTGKARQAQEPTPSRIPGFESREAAAAWFDTHDMADYQDEFRTVRARFAKGLSEGLNIRLDKETLAALRELARERGVGPSTLVRMWVLEHLRAESSKSA